MHKAYHLVTVLKQGAIAVHTGHLKYVPSEKNIVLKDKPYLGYFYVSQKGEYDDKLRPTTFFQEQEKLTFQCVTYGYEESPKNKLLHLWEKYGKKVNTFGITWYFKAKY